MAAALARSPFSAPQEAAVRLVLPAYVAAAPPPGLAELVQTAVVPDPEAGVRLDRIGRELAEPRPPVEEARRRRNHGFDRVPSTLRIALGECGFERRGDLGRRFGEDGLGRTTAVEPDRSVGHARNLPAADWVPGAGRRSSLIVTALRTGTIGVVTHAAPPTTPNGEKPSHPPTTKLVLVRHAVTAQTGPLLSGRAPGIDLSESA